MVALVAGDHHLRVGRGGVVLVTPRFHQGHVHVRLAGQLLARPRWNQHTRSNHFPFKDISEMVLHLPVDSFLAGSFRFFVVLRRSLRCRFARRTWGPTRVLEARVTRDRITSPLVVSPLVMAPFDAGDSWSLEVTFTCWAGTASTTSSLECESASSEDSLDEDADWTNKTQAHSKVFKNQPSANALDLV